MKKLYRIAHNVLNIHKKIHGQVFYDLGGIKMVFEGLEAAYCTGICWRNGSGVMVGGGGVGGCIVLYFGAVQARGGSIPHA